MPCFLRPWRLGTALLLGIAALSACSGQDDEFFPYRMKGLDVWVYDSAAEEDFYAGFVEATYSARRDGLSRCAALADQAARERHLKEWSHVCCTVTSSSQCETKVR